MRILIARTTEDVECAMQQLSSARVIGCDTETSGFNSKVGRLYSIQFSDGDLSVLVPLSEGLGMGRFAELLANSAIVKVFHNARFDLEFLSAGGYEITSVFDTMIAEKLLTRGAGQSVSLADTLYRYFAVDLDKSQRARFTKKWDGIWTEDLIEYALADVVHLPRLMQEQREWLKRLGLSKDCREQFCNIFGQDKVTYDL